MKQTQYQQVGFPDIDMRLVLAKKVGLGTLEFCFISSLFLPYCSQFVTRSTVVSYKLSLFLPYCSKVETSLTTVVSYKSSLFLPYCSEVVARLLSTVMSGVARNWCT